MEECSPSINLHCGGNHFANRIKKQSRFGSKCNKSEFRRKNFSGIWRAQIFLIPTGQKKGRNEHPCVSLDETISVREKGKYAIIVRWIHTLNRPPTESIFMSRDLSMFIERLLGFEAAFRNFHTGRFQMHWECRSGMGGEFVLCPT